jgi:DNA-nicking Smr family endonuclease
MAKREEKTKRASRPKPAEPFFRPFSKLPRKSEQAEPKTPAPKTSAPAAARPSRAKEKDKRAEADAAPAPVDPQTFAIYMAGVQALPEDRAHRIPRTASRVERVPQAERGAGDDLDADARARMRSLVTEGLRFETVDDGERLEGRRLDVDPRELRRLRRGQYAVDGKLDLHGLGADEARQTVEAFIKKRAKEGDRAVLIVHGKGSHSPRGHAVLRGEIAAWLSQGRAARHVAAFATASEDLGGTGAVFVLLAR